MHYIGGKYNIARHLVKEIEARREGRVYLEPFVGGGHVLERVPHGNGRKAGDANTAVVRLYSSIQAGWEPPDTLTKEEHRSLKEANDALNPMTAFAGIGCSFMGMWFASYCDRAPVVKRGLIRQGALFKGVEFRAQPYQTWVPVRRMIYCDPPYANTIGYMTGAFDHGAFWRRLQEWAAPDRGNTILVSEYVCPPGAADLIAEWPVRGKMKTGGRAVERLFQVKPKE